MKSVSGLSLQDWIDGTDKRGAEIGRYDGMLYSQAIQIQTQILLEQAHDTYVLGILDAVPLLCRTALEEELAVRYLIANKMLQQVASGQRFEQMVDGKPANLENLIQWVIPNWMSKTLESIARDIQQTGNDYAHAYAMRRVAKPMNGSGNVFENKRALEVYRNTLEVITKLAPIP